MNMRLACVALLAAAGAAQADLVVNGGFETGDMTGWTVVHTGNFSGINVGGVAGAHTGNYYYGMGAVAASDASDFYQDVPTSPGQQYTASFWGNDYAGGNGIINVTIGGVNIGPVNGVLPGDNTYHQYSLVFTATAATTRLESIGYEPSDYVSSDDYSVVPVPAPASLALLGLGGLIAGRRRRS